MACEYEEEYWDIQSYLYGMHLNDRLSQLEHTRDELLVQLYLSEESFVEKNTVSIVTPNPPP